MLNDTERTAAFAAALEHAVRKHVPLSPSILARVPVCSRCSPPAPARRACSRRNDGGDRRWRRDSSRRTDSTTACESADPLSALDLDSMPPAATLGRHALSCSSSKCLALTLCVKGCCLRCGTRARRCLRRARRWCRERSRCMPAWSRARRSRRSACGATRHTGSTCAPTRWRTACARCVCRSCPLTAHRRGGGAETRARRRGAAGGGGRGDDGARCPSGRRRARGCLWWEADLGGGATVSTAPGGAA